eukprot:gene2031-biopygen13988
MQRKTGRSVTGGRQPHGRAQSTYECSCGCVGGCLAGACHMNRFSHRWEKRGPFTNLIVDPVFSTGGKTIHMAWTPANAHGRTTDLSGTLPPKARCPSAREDGDTHTQQRMASSWRAIHNCTILCLRLEGASMHVLAHICDIEPTVYDYTQS